MGRLTLLCYLSAIISVIASSPIVERSPRSRFIQKAVGIGYVSSLAVITPLFLRASNADDKREKVLRSELLAAIPPRANILEIGFGSGNGANLEAYPAYPSSSGGITVTGLDPSIVESNFLDIRKQYVARGINLKRLINGNGESLSTIFQAGRFDAVVATLVLCSVQSPEVVLAQVAHVLKPRTGLFLSVEHIQATGGWLSKTQEVLDPLQQVVAHNCHLTRRTDELFADTHGLRVREIQRYDFPSQFPISSQIYSVLQKE